MAKKKGCDVKINWEMRRKKIFRASCGLILGKFVIYSAQRPDLFWPLKKYGFRILSLKKKLKQRLEQSPNLNNEKMINPTSFPSVSNMKSIAGNSEIPPVWLTGRLSLAGNSPKFNFSSASSSTQSSSSARSPESSRSAQTETESRPSMVSNFPKPPPDSSPRNAGQCGRSNSVLLLLYFLRIPNI